MVTTAQIDKLGRRIDQLAAAIDPAEEAVKVVVFRGESPDFALARHRELRPEHAGRLVRLEYRGVERNDVHELAAVFIGATSEDTAAFDRWLADMPKESLGDMVAERYRSRQISASSIATPTTLSTTASQRDRCSLRDQ
jgi:hypothetical protein